MTPVPEEKADEERESSNVVVESGFSFDPSLQSEDSPFTASSPSNAGSSLTNEGTDDARHGNLVILDERVKDAETLIAGLGLSDYAILQIDSSEDGFARITSELQGFATHSLQSLYVISHGSDGRIQLGDALITNETLAMHAPQMAHWNGFLTDDADILIFGCDVARGATGQQLLQQISFLTGADVAGSIDATGNRQWGGNWDFEFSSGSIESRISANFDQLDRYMHLLATGTESADILTGSSVTETHDGLAGNDVLIGDANVASDGQFLQAANPGLHQSYFTGQTFGSWTVTAGNVELIGTYWQSSPSGGYSIDMDGTVPGTIQQTISTISGNTYQIRFLMSANGTGTVTKALEASVAGVMQDFSITTASTHSSTSMDWQERFMTFTATASSTTLQFKSLSANGSAGAVLADVVVADITTNNGNDTLNGGAGADTIIGSGGNAIINGGSEDDWIRGGSGSEIIDGGTGTDTLVFSGSRQDYQVSFSGSMYTFTDLRSGASDGTDIVTNIETFRFVDQDYTTTDVALRPPTFENFDNGDLTGWTGGAIVTSNAVYGAFITSAAAFNNQSSVPGTLGIVNTQDIFKIFSLSGNQTSVTLSFNFHRLDTWDNESFNVYLNDILQSNQVCGQSSVQTNSVSTPDHAASSNLGFGGGDDVTYTYVLTYATTGTTLKIGFGSSLNEVWSNEAWGVDNLLR